MFCIFPVHEGVQAKHMNNRSPNKQLEVHAVGVLEQKQDTATMQNQSLSKREHAATWTARVLKLKFGTACTSAVSCTIAAGFPTFRSINGLPRPWSRSLLPMGEIQENRGSPRKISLVDLIRELF